MLLAIHSSKGSFSDRWIDYCKNNCIPYKVVDCYGTDIVKELEHCDALMWHSHQNDPKAILFARQLMYSLEMAGKNVFPDFYTAWHFDDKVGQKYLLESIGAPLVPSWVFYDKKDALNWAKNATFPKVFKLRGGAGSQNVRLVRNRKSAFKLIRKAFSTGFLAYDPHGSLKERWRKFRLGKVGFIEVIVGMARFIKKPPYALVKGRERGYIYFQEFIPGSDHDIRVYVIGDKAFAIKRMVRDNDFRASGSGEIRYERNLIKESIIKLSFGLYDKLYSQSVAFDYIYENDTPLLIEISYGFVPDALDSCPGYWDKDLNWHESNFDPCSWMVDNLVKNLETI